MRSTDYVRANSAAVYVAADLLYTWRGLLCAGGLADAEDELLEVCACTMTLAAAHTGFAYSSLVMSKFVRFILYTKSPEFRAISSCQVLLLCNLHLRGQLPPLL